VAKGLGGGFPVGAVLATQEAAKGLTPGSHGSTFGGNPLAMAVASEVLEVVLEKDFLSTVANTGLALKSGLENVKAKFPALVREVRGEGLLLGIRLDGAVTTADAVKAALAEKLLCVGAAENVLRILPPLIVTADEVTEGLDRLARALARLAAKS
jgi:acetylornithine/N-succinyldiaminopimelate aminotransferase